MLLTPEYSNATFNGSDTVSITWIDDNPHRHHQILIERRQSNLFTYEEIAVVESSLSTYNDDTAEPNRRYFYRFTAINDSIEEDSGTSEDYLVSTLVAPEIPTGFNASYIDDHINPHSVILSWVLNDKNLSVINIQRSTDNINFTDIDTIGGLQVSYVDDTVSEGQTYYYRLQTVNDISSRISSSIQVVIPDAFLEYTYAISYMFIEQTTSKPKWRLVLNNENEIQLYTRYSLPPVLEEYVTTYGSTRVKVVRIGTTNRIVGVVQDIEEIVPTSSVYTVTGNTVIEF